MASHLIHNPRRSNIKSFSLLRGKGLILLTKYLFLRRVRQVIADPRTGQAGPLAPPGRSLVVTHRRADRRVPRRVLLTSHPEYIDSLEDTPHISSRRDRSVETARPRQAQYLIPA